MHLVIVEEVFDFLYCVLSILNNYYIHSVTCWKHLSGMMAIRLFTDIDANRLPIYQMLPAKLFTGDYVFLSFYNEHCVGYFFSKIWYT